MLFPRALNLLVLKTSQKPKIFLAILQTFLFSLFLLSSPVLVSEGADYETVNYKGQKLSILRDSLTQAPVIIRGFDSNLLEIKNFSKLSREEITHTGPILVNKYKSLLQIEPDQLKLKGAEKIGDTWYVSYWQTFHGVIIYESSLGYSIDSRGKIKSMGALLYPRVQAPVTSKVSHEEALKIGQSQVKDFKKLKCFLLAENILIYPVKKKNSIDYYRVYAFNFFPQEALHPASVVGGWAVFVDTQTGKKVLHEELLKPLGCCVPLDYVPPKLEDMKPKW
jgi:Zn-dependent metalloprotease